MEGRVEMINAAPRDRHERFVAEHYWLNIIA
jgi:hypothetical protein